MIELEDILAATGGKLRTSASSKTFAGFAFDSRRLACSTSPPLGPLFVAVRTETGDGHDYVAEAVRRGATGVLCEYPPSNIPAGAVVVVVQDTRQALLDWAQFILRKYGTRVVAVTGSSGKTVTKEAIAAVLGTRHAVFRNQGTYSGRFGLPIALGELLPSQHVAVLELAADSVGEIRDLAALVRPQIGVVTTINQAHIENLGSIEAIATEKSGLVESLPRDGFAVLNRDDPRVWSMRSQTAAQTVSFGFDPVAECGVHSLFCNPEGLDLTIRLRGAFRNMQPELSTPRFMFRLFGRHHAYAALAAVSVGCLFDIPVTDCLDALSQFQPMPGRLNLVSGRNGSLVLDDTYDAETACTLAALDALEDHFGDRKHIVVLGPLRGHRQLDSSYQAVGARAASVADEIVLKGEPTSPIRIAALAAGMESSAIFETFSAQEISRHLDKRISPDSVVLVKGAREERMEEITQQLLEDPSRAPALLVRQEEAYRQANDALPQRPTWLEVNLEAIAQNLHCVQRLVGSAVGIVVILKADAYGHGAVRIARTALNNGAQMLGVACLGEAIALRQAGIQSPILVLGYTPAWQAREAVLNEITTTVFDLETIRSFSNAAGQVGRLARIHIKVDTGMGRLGLLPDQVLPVLTQALQFAHLEIEGIFTHFSVADAADKSYTYRQLGRFRRVLDDLEHAGITFPLVHAANSAALLTVPESRFNLVRLGIALYGLAPSEYTPLPPGFQPALTFKTRIAQVKTLPPQSPVSYGNTYQTTGYERIAVIPVGYADGFRRAPAHWGEVLVRGQRAPIVGRVCMDQTMINVSHIAEVRQGDTVVLIGKQGDQEITVDQVAKQLGTINYEIVSEILARVPRVS